MTRWDVVYERRRRSCGIHPLYNCCNASLIFTILPFGSYGWSRKFLVRSAPKKITFAALRIPPDGSKSLTMVLRLYPAPSGLSPSASDRRAGINPEGEGESAQPENINPLTSC